MSFIIYFLITTYALEILIKKKLLYGLLRVGTQAGGYDKS